MGAPMAGDHRTAPLNTGDEGTGAKDIVVAYQQLRRMVEGSAELPVAILDAMRHFDGELQDFAETSELRLLRYQLLFEEAPDPYLVTDDQGTITQANAAARALLDVDTPVTGTKLVGYVAAAHREPFEGWLRQLRADLDAARWDTVLELESGGRRIPAEISLADDLEGIGYRWLLRDQRERAAAERQLRQVAESEHSAAEELRSEARTKAGFLVSLSHDLRAPIGALVHQAELLTTSDLSDDVRRRSKSALEDNATLLSQMLDALVEIERFALGELQVHPVPTQVRTLLGEVSDIEDVAIEVTVPDDEIFVDVDAAAVRRALRALLSSAKLRSDGSRLSIRAETKSSQLVVTLSSSRRDAFTEGSPLSDSRVDVRLARTLIELHGGRLWTTQNGTEHSVSVSLPLSADQAAPRP